MGTAGLIGCGGTETRDSTEQAALEAPGSEYEPVLEGTPTHSRIVRLTHRQWTNSVAQLLHLERPAGWAEAFEDAPPLGTFGNNERALEVTSTLVRDYRIAAEHLAEEVTANELRLSQLSELKTGGDFVVDFGRRIFRRPLTTKEAQIYTDLYHSAPELFPGLTAHAAGVRLVLQTMLQSPNFIYRTELREGGERIGGYETAAKLSLLLLNTTPSEALLNAADSGRLGTQEGLSYWASRLLGDPRSVASALQFYKTWLGTRRYVNIRKSSSLFPQYTEALNADLQFESEKFLEQNFARDQGLSELLRSTSGFVNVAIAPLYDVSAPESGWVEKELGDERPGFLTRVGFLATNGTLTEPDPIHRGVDVARRFLCTTLVAPPGAIPQLPPLEANQTNRERVAASTEMEGSACAGCHGPLINPLGFAFENYDALGGLRRQDNGRPIDVTGSYVMDGTPVDFDGARELTALLAKSPQAHGCFVRRLTEYALARDLDWADTPLVAELTLQSLAGASTKTLLGYLVQSEQFLVRLQVK